MTDPLPIILTIVVALPFIVALLAMFLLPMFKHREKGPWVVCRVAADGSGGMEYLGVSDGGGVWTKSVDWASNFLDEESAKRQPEAELADVAPLSRFTGSSHV